MIVMDVKADNFYGFHDFHVNMAYPKKLVRTMIPSEYLKDRTNFRYKKLNILMGANATGKTSLGNLLRIIFGFISLTPYGKTSLLSGIGKIEKTASFSIDFIPDLSNELYRVEAEIEPTLVGRYVDNMFHVTVKRTNIRHSDDYERCAERLDEMQQESSFNFEDALSRIPRFTWMMTFAEHEELIDSMERGRYSFQKVLEKVLKCLDSSVIRVERINNADNSYVIKMDAADVIIQKGRIMENSILSSGTKAGVDLAFMLTWMLNGYSDFYYCDEKFSYMHSDVEKAFLSVMVSLLKGDKQLFFTTHNLEILDMQYPIHSYIFMKKEHDEFFEKIRCEYASDYLKKNTDSVRNAVENDLYATAPDVEGIYELVEGEV